MTIRRATERVPLQQGWEYTVVAAEQLMTPQDCTQARLAWQAALVPGTVAGNMRAAGQFSFDQLPPFDQQDYWYRCSCSLPEQAVLHFTGLATFAQVFWNDQLILVSDNMFVAYRVDMQDYPGNGILSIRFSAVATQLKKRRPRPRWRTRLVEQQQLRWVRSSLLGRLPGWSPAVPAIGPYRAIEIESPVHVSTSDSIVIKQITLNSHLDVDGVVDVQFIVAEQSSHCQSMSARLAQHQRWFLHVGEHRQELNLSDIQVSGTLRIAQPVLWWPHTHGDPFCYPVSLVMESDVGSHSFVLGTVAFRSVQLIQQTSQHDDTFAVHINQTPVFCRGACWTPVDILTLAPSAALRATLMLARDAGMNMLRVGGTMVYESDAFYALCDELGIMVWQDFMFANMDYPVADPEFLASIETEANQFLQRVRYNPCLVVLCGNSEVAQQSAMTGMSQECWSNDFFTLRLPELCHHYRPDVTYWCSSPSGGALPFQVDSGVSHYYGLGAYLRPLDDARRAGVRFTTECLGFANIPDEATIDALLPGAESPLHHPRWKQRVPRDGGAGWDFDDVRDHYMELLFSVDAVRLRYSDMSRYLALARVTSGLVMEHALAEWRRANSTCKGALIWFLRDIWPGAGWGLIDALGRPKAAYFQVKRAMAAQAIFISDEGLNGLELHVINDAPSVFLGSIELTLYRYGEVPVATATIPVDVAAHGTFRVRADTLFPHFIDCSYAYRFGPPGHDVTVARLLATDAHDNTVLISDAFHFPLGINANQERDLGLQAEAQTLPDGSRLLYLTTRKLALSVAISVPGFMPIHNYLHLAPGAIRCIPLHPNGDPIGSQGQVHALNSISASKIVARI